jgi:organic radical activating enzyme
MTQANPADESIFSYAAVGVAASWHCDAKCSHCYIPVGERRRDGFDEKVAEASLRGLPENVQWVVFTGGEPFLHPSRLAGLVRTVAESGRSASVVTNGAWALEWDRAEELLSEARQSGLRGMTVSVDEYHRPAVPLDTIARLLKRAQELGFIVNVAGVGKEGREKIALLEADGLALARPQERNLFDLENVGIASSLETDRVRKLELNGCRAVMEPLISPDGSVFACCSYWLFNVRTPALLRGNVLSRPVGEILKEASSDYLLAAVAAVGPAGLLELLGRSAPRNVVSPCSLCLSLLNDAAVVTELRDRIGSDKELRKELVGWHMIYQSHQPAGVEGRGT